MNKREKIIIFLAGLMALYGALDYFVLGKKSSATGEEDKIKAAVQQTDAFAAAATAQLTAMVTQNKGKNLTYTKKMAETPWPRDPFIVHTGTDKTVDQEEINPADLPEIIYSGYIRAGAAVLAVINGMEYTVGELVADIGYKVHNITPSKVVLLTESNKQITIYLQED
ncbi:MAG: hypothetical protein HUN04_14260 [Desulfobacter sp.]|nr:MAG: hypothetical protein HUN04_14260 [Desulfobacter sp.]